MVPSIDTRSRSTSPEGKSASASSLPFPFGEQTDIHTLLGNTITTGQTLVEQSLYSVAKHIFAYDAETFQFGKEISNWAKRSTKNPQGLVPAFTSLETRAGAGSGLLGYIESQATTAHTPVLGSSTLLEYFKPTLAQYAASNEDLPPLHFALAAIGYNQTTQSLITDYATPINVARDLGLNLIASTSFNDVQHITVFASVLSLITPVVQVYDGIHYLRESVNVENVLHTGTISDAYQKLIGHVDDLRAIDNPQQRVASLLNLVNNCFGSSYHPFEYFGSKEAETVIVSFGSSESTITSKVVSALGAKGIKVGSVSVRIYFPFLEAEFVSLLPPTVKNIIVLGQVGSETDVTDVAVHSALFTDVTASLLLTQGFDFRAIPDIIDHKYSTNGSFIESDILEVLNQADANISIEESKGNFIFWNVDDANTLNVPNRLAHALSLENENRNIDYITTFDNVALAGVVQTELRISDNYIPAPSSHIENAEVVVVSSPKILEVFDVLENAKVGGTVLLSTSYTTEELEQKIPFTFKKTAFDKDIKLFLLNHEAIGEHPETAGKTESMVEQIAFWNIIKPELGEKIAHKIWLSNGDDIELVAAILVKLGEKVVGDALKQFPIPETWSKIEDTNADAKNNEDSTTVDDEKKEEAVEEAITCPSIATPTSFSVSDKSLYNAPVPEVNSWIDIAKKLAFQEAYNLEKPLRPDLPVKNFIVKVKENRRVTPDYYDRNIFHIEFDTTGTGLKYEIGEALGIHGKNNGKNVQEFLDLYGLDPSKVVTVPSRDDPEILESRTVFQSFSENLDLFGKPPKRFYESLSKFATNEVERKQLEKLVSPEGVDELKKLQEVEFATYADVFEQFKSARPPVEELISLIAPLKRREYSIASSQRVHPNAVHLLIVVVDWIDKKGRKRFGHCSKYISDLNIGEELVVSVKPSVMKLPKLTTAPIVMSGLGTGLAPFKAFVEEKLWQKQNGHEIGDIYLYLGSRHKKEEYLYGELWEAYKDAGIITHIGAAFSRDQPQKIYIQDKIRESMDSLVGAMIEKKGSFYLCGPTWPVPDITAVLSDIIVKEAKERGVKVDTSKEIEALKEAERYILEVY